MKKGFTLLELIVVITIIGVLTSLALPRLFSTIEYSRSAEAITAFSSIRASMERCRLWVGSYSQPECIPDYDSDFFSGLDIEDPGLVSNAHFTYRIDIVNPDEYFISAERNARDGGDGRSIIQFYVKPDCPKEQVFTCSAIVGPDVGAFHALGTCASHCGT